MLPPSIIKHKLYIHISFPLVRNLSTKLTFLKNADVSSYPPADGVSLCTGC